MQSRRKGGRQPLAGRVPGTRSPGARTVGKGRGARLGNFRNAGGTVWARRTEYRRRKPKTAPESGARARGAYFTQITTGTFYIVVVAAAAASSAIYNRPARVVTAV